MEAKNWIAIGAASALSLGVMAAGAVSTANALPLVAGATSLPVPGISLGENADMKGNALSFAVSSDSIVTPSPSTSPSPSPSSTISPASASAPSPASPPSPPSPPSPASPASPASVDSPASLDSVD